jgi:hypothetical protein
MRFCVYFFHAARARGALPEPLLLFVATRLAFMRAARYGEGRKPAGYVKNQCKHRSALEIRLIREVCAIMHIADIYAIDRDRSAH